MMFICLKSTLLILRHRSYSQNAIHDSIRKKVPVIFVLYNVVVTYDTSALSVRFSAWILCLVYLWQSLAFNCICCYGIIPNVTQQNTFRVIILAGYVNGTKVHAQISL